MKHSGGNRPPDNKQKYKWSRDQQQTNQQQQPPSQPLPQATYIQPNKFKLVRGAQTTQAQPTITNNQSGTQNAKNKFKYVRPEVLTSQQKIADTVQKPSDDPQGLANKTAPTPSVAVKPAATAAAVAINQQKPTAQQQKQQDVGYKKSTKGNTLTRAASATIVKSPQQQQRGKRNLTWQNPNATATAGAAAGPPSTTTTKADNASKPSGPPSTHTTAAPPQPPKTVSKPTSLLPAALRNKRLGRNSLGTVATRKWNTYVRTNTPIASSLVSRTNTSITALDNNNAMTHLDIGAGAETEGMQPGSSSIFKRRSPRIKAFLKAKSRVKRGTSTQQQQQLKAQKLLRIGDSMYQVYKGSRSRSLRRQDPQQQQQQTEQNTTNLATTATTTSSLPKPTPKPTTTKPLFKKKKLKLTSTRNNTRLRPPQIIYCPKYCLTGVCSRRGKGCRYKHDPVKRAVCVKWLKGDCPAGKECPLQHQRKPNLMPLCMHYLRGTCTADPCAFLHVNVAPDAPVCPAFLQGYCARGTTCPYKHYTLRMVREERKLSKSTGVKRKKSIGGAGGSSRHQYNSTSQERQNKGAVAGGVKKRPGRYFDEPLEPFVHPDRSEDQQHEAEEDDEEDEDHEELQRKTKRRRKAQKHNEDDDPVLEEGEEDGMASGTHSDTSNNDDMSEEESDGWSTLPDFIQL